LRQKRKNLVGHGEGKKPPPRAEKKKDSEKKGIGKGPSEKRPLPEGEPRH